MIKLFDKDMNEVIVDQDTYQTKIFPLDNFSPFAFIMNGIKFNTSEHAFQYLKFSNTSILTAEAIKDSYSPYDARELARKYRQYRRADWADVKYEMMEKVIKSKIEYNPTVKQALLDTGDYIIAECCKDEDTDWGIDRNNKGENHLGKILMKIRYELNKELENETVIKR